MDRLFSLLSWYLYEEDGMLSSHTSYMHLLWEHFLYLVLTKLWKKWLVSENLKWLNRILMTCKVILIQTFITVLSSKTWFANTLIIILTVNRATQMISILTRIAHAGLCEIKLNLSKKETTTKKLLIFYIANICGFLYRASKKGLSSFATVLWLSR